MTVTIKSRKKLGFQKSDFFLLQIHISDELLNQFLRSGVF